MGPMPDAPGGYKDYAGSLGSTDARTLSNIGPGDNPSQREV